MIVYDSRGNPLEIGTALAKGGEAIVYRMEGNGEQLAKLYVPAPRKDYPKKVAWMVANPPTFPTTTEFHRFVAWPTETLHNQRGQFAGYLMPFIRDAVPLLHVYSPKLRARTLPHFDSRYRYRAAQHLAYALSVLHQQGYVVGDLNESNILVTPSARITVIDADSFQMWRVEGGEQALHPCPVGKAEYLPPELQGLSLIGTVRQREHDNFALAVLIFKLLMGGHHPFQSQWKEAGEPPALEQKIARGWFPHVAAPEGPVAPPPHVPPLDTLPHPIQQLLHRAFVEGHRTPTARPTPKEWVDTLRAVEATLHRCKNDHYFARHLARCPECGAPRALFPPQVERAMRATERQARQIARRLTARVREGLPSSLPPTATWPHPFQSRFFWSELAGQASPWGAIAVSGVMGLLAGRLIAALQLLPGWFPLLLWLLASTLAPATATFLSRAEWQRLLSPPRRLFWHRTLPSGAGVIQGALLASSLLVLLLLPTTLRLSPHPAPITLPGVVAAIMLAGTLWYRRRRGWHFALLPVLLLLFQPNLTWLLSGALLLLLVLLLFHAATSALLTRLPTGTPTGRAASLARPTAALLWLTIGLLALLPALPGRSPQTMPAETRPSLPLVITQARPLARVVNVAPLRLNVRTAPAPDAPIVASLEEGTEVELMESTEAPAGWQRVRAATVEGWVSRDYLRGD